MQLAGRSGTSAAVYLDLGKVNLDTEPYTRTEVDHPPIGWGHVSVRVEHQRPPARRWRVTSWSVPCLMLPYMGAKNGVLRQQPV